MCQYTQSHLFLLIVNHIHKHLTKFFVIWESFTSEDIILYQIVRFFDYFGPFLAHNVCSCSFCFKSTTTGGYNNNNNNDNNSHNNKNITTTGNQKYYSNNCNEPSANVGGWRKHTPPCGDSRGKKEAKNWPVTPAAAATLAKGSLTQERNE